jgi:RNA polymerase sigma-70 factor (ECF subfamily)
MELLADTYKNVIAAQNGNEAAWNFLFQQHYPWMYAAALHICGNSPTAKDAVQETFLGAYLKLHQLKDANAFAGWLRTSLIRRCHRNMNASLLPAAEDLSSVGSSCLWDDEISKKLDRNALQTRLYHILACLPDILQTVLLLRYFSDFNSYEEIAAILCIPIGTVRSRLNQAKQKMISHWLDSSADNDRAFRQAQEWNQLYHIYFGNVYISLHYREKLINHFDKNLHLVFTSGKTVFGRNLIEKEIEEDILHGSGFGALQVMSSGNISIVETHNINSPRHRNRCPDSTVFVLHRNGNRITRLHLHHSGKKLF